MTDIIFNYPAPDQQQINWMRSDTLSKNEKIAKDVISKVNQIPAKEEYLVQIYNEINHVRFDRDLGSCSCKKFEYTSGQPAYPCVHMIKVREAIAENTYGPISDQHIQRISVIETSLKEKKQLKKTVKKESTKDDPKEAPKEDPTEVPKLKYICSECMEQITEAQADNTIKVFGKQICRVCEPIYIKEMNKAKTNRSQEPNKEATTGQPSVTSVVTTGQPSVTSWVTTGQQQVTELDIIELIKTIVGNDVLEIFGESGSGKSMFCVEIAKKASAKGLKVFYLDTERNLTQNQIESMKGVLYQYTPVMSEITNISKSLGKGDIVILDSVGYPVLTTYARLTMKQKGDALLNLIAIFGDLKEWAYKNNGLAIVINQPESEFNKEPGHIYRPFGDKSQFAAKEIWRSDLTNRGATTNITLQAFRSRSMGYNKKIMKISISDKGVEITKM